MHPAASPSRREFPLVRTSGWLTTPPAAAVLLVAPHDPGPRGLLGSVGLVLVAGLVVAHLRVARALAGSQRPPASPAGFLPRGGLVTSGGAVARILLPRIVRGRPRP